MDFQLSEDQRAYADTAHDVFADFCSDEQMQRFDKSGSPFQQDLWQQCIATGLHTMIVPEAEGGLGLGITELINVLQEQGQALALVPLWEHQLAAAALADFGTPALRQRVLADALADPVAGDALLTLGLGPLAAARGNRLQATVNDQGWVLQGQVAAVPFGGVARHALLIVNVEGVERILLADLNAAGVRRVSGSSQRHEQIADLFFEQAVVGADALLAEPALRWLEARAIACLAALQIGVSTQQLTRTVHYISERKQFDRVIGSFQLVAGQMADGHIALEALRTSLWQLSYRLDAGEGVMPQAWATRFLACEAGHRIGHMAQHVHGGIGVDISFPIHRFLFWSRALGAALGGTERNLAKLGDWLADHDLLGWKYDLAEDKTF